MEYMAIGMGLFLSTHDLGLNQPLRTLLKERLGETVYKVIYSIVTLLGLALISVGFANYRSDGLTPLWDPPVWARHLALFLNWFAIVFVIAAYLPCYLRKWLKHPMLVGVKIWASAHLLANGDVGGLFLFGCFLIWAVIIRISIKRRPVVVTSTKISYLYDFVALFVGSIIYAGIVFWLHPKIFNIPVWPG